MRTLLLLAFLEGVRSQAAGFYLNFTGCDANSANMVNIPNPCRGIWTLNPSLSDTSNCGYYTDLGALCTGAQRKAGQVCPQPSIDPDFMNTAPTYPIFTSYDGIFNMYMYTYLSNVSKPVAIIGLAACAPPYHSYNWETTLYTSSNFTSGSPFAWANDAFGWAVNNKLITHQPLNTKMTATYVPSPPPLEAPSPPPPAPPPPPPA